MSLKEGEKNEGSATHLAGWGGCGERLMEMRVVVEGEEGWMTPEHRRVMGCLYSEHLVPQGSTRVGVGGVGRFLIGAS